MTYSSNDPISANFDISIILPFYKKLEEFKKVLPLNSKYFNRNGVELIIVMDEPSEKDGLLELIKSYPLINWVIIVNENPHIWRNPAKAINVGIKASNKNFIMVCSPESIFETDVVFQLLSVVVFYKFSFAIGDVYFDSQLENITATHLKYKYPYGSIVVKKEHLLQINGYSECFHQWGGEDDNLRAKLEYIGIRKMHVPSAVMRHYEKDIFGQNNRTEKAGQLPEFMLKKSYHPEKEDFINEGWGEDFSKIIYDYKNNLYAKELCSSYLKNNLENYEIVDTRTFTKSFKVVALIQTNNEIYHIKNVLKHLDTICDGVILLDDGSNDYTYEHAMGKKLLIKGRKVNCEFDDLKNRNILLDMASFVNSEWFFFIDADERLELFGRNLKALLNEKFNAGCFYLVHLWDNDQNYRVDINELSPINLPGVFHRWRVFKNIGRS